MVRAAWEILALIGMGTMGYGLWLVWPPAAIFFGGFAAFIVGLKGYKDASR